MLSCRQEREKGKLLFLIFLVITEETYYTTPRKSLNLRHRVMRIV